MTQNNTPSQLPWWQTYYAWVGIYAILVVVVVGKELLTAPHIDNFIIFRNSFEHLIHGKKLYGFYLEEYKSLYNYGPTFAALMCVFWIIPFEVSAFLWNFVMAFVLLWAIWRLPITPRAKAFIALVSLNELFTTLLNFQTNPAISACIIFTWLLLDEDKPFWAAAVVSLGVITKIYAGIAGIFILLYLRHFWKFALWGIVWLVIWIAVPLFFTSFPLLVFQYQSWWEALNYHTHRNAMSAMQMVTFIAGQRIPNPYTMLPALGLLLWTFARYELWQDVRYRLYLLASVLMFIVIFNPAAESPTYIIAFVGMGLWLSQRTLTRGHLALLFFVLIFGSLSTTDIFPPSIRRLYVYEYQLKCVPYILAWCVLWYETLTYPRPSANA